MDVVEGYSSDKDWVIAGDFNLTPQECWLSDVLCAEGAHCVFPSGATTSRWDGNRLIDYGLTSVFGAQASFLSVRYSDHKALMLQIPWSSHDRVAVEVLKKAPKLFPVSSDDAGRWSQAVSDAWAALSWSLDQAKHEWDTVLLAGRDIRQQMVDELWTSWQGKLEQVLLSARDSLLSTGCQFQGAKRLALSKGGRPKIVRRTPHCSQVYADDESNQARVLRRLAARLYEYERRTAVGEASQALDALARKIRRSSYWVEGLTSQNVYARLQAHEKLVSGQKIGAWRHKLRSDTKHCFAWLRGHKEPVNHCIYDDEAQALERQLGTQSPLEALNCLAQFGVASGIVTEKANKTFMSTCVLQGVLSTNRFGHPSLHKSFWHALGNSDTSHSDWINGALTRCCLFLKRLGNSLRCSFALVNLRVVFRGSLAFSSRLTFRSFSVPKVRSPTVAWPLL